MNKMICALSMVVAAVAGCSTMPRQEAQHAGNVGAQMRGASSVHPKRARALVSGPVVVQHLETEGDGAVTLYLADDPGIADRACPSAPAENAPPVAHLERQSRLTDLVVPAGMRICAAATATHTMTVTWHARPIVDAPRESFDLALRSALDGGR
ncbi:MAG TPA: hypothetical protein VHO67_01460 [Polyangia bacterium]|nr:hypothetical protein [Polyangia bacterium]